MTGRRTCSLTNLGLEDLLNYILAAVFQQFYKLIDPVPKPSFPTRTILVHPRQVDVCAERCGPMATSEHWAEILVRCGITSCSCEDWLRMLSSCTKIEQGQPNMTQSDGGEEERKCNNDRLAMEQRLGERCVE